MTVKADTPKRKPATKSNRAAKESYIDANTVEYRTFNPSTQKVDTTIRTYKPVVSKNRLDYNHQEITKMNAIQANHVNTDNAQKDREKLELAKREGSTQDIPSRLHTSNVAILPLDKLEDMRQQSDYYDILVRMGFDAKAAFTQKVEGIRHEYVLATRKNELPSGKIKTEVIMINRDAKGKIIIKEFESVSSAKTHLRLLNSQSTSLVDTSPLTEDNIAMRKKAFIEYTFAEPKPATDTPKVKRDFVIMRTSDRALWSVSGEFIARREGEIDNLEITQHYTHMQAYKTAFKVRLETGEHCKRVHISQVDGDKFTAVIAPSQPSQNYDNGYINQSSELLRVTNSGLVEQTTDQSFDITVETV